MSNFGAVEPALADLRDDIKILVHMAHSSDTPTEAEWSRMADHLELSRETLADQWKLAHEERNEERAAHEADLEALRAELEKEKQRRAVPGSAADIEHARGLWALLRSAARVTLQECERAAVAGKPKPKTAGRRKRA